MLQSTLKQFPVGDILAFNSSKWNQISLKLKKKRKKEICPFSLRWQALMVTSWWRVDTRALGQVYNEQGPWLQLRETPRICRKLKMSILIYSHRMHCLVVAKSKQWKHWNTKRNGKCWQLETLYFRPHCHSLSQTVWQGWNLKLLTLRTLFPFSALSSQTLLYQDSWAQHAFNSSRPMPASPGAAVGGRNTCDMQCTGRVQPGSSHLPASVLGLPSYATSPSKEHSKQEANP